MFTIDGTHYSNCHLVVFHNNIDSDHHINVLIVFFYTFRSAQLNMDGHMGESECIKCITS